MGAWGFGNFENDDAGDWINEFKKKPAEASLKRPLEKVAAHGNEYLQGPTCSRALAAAEIVAALKGRPNAKQPEGLQEVLDEVKPHFSEDLTPIALEALAQIINDSETKELWEEDEDDAAAWYAEVDDLRARLAQ
jgi:hypothetical protein